MAMAAWSPLVAFSEANAQGPARTRAASPDVTTGPLQRAEAAYDDLEFEDAARLYREALAVPGTLEERVRAYRGLAMCLAFLGDAAGAQLQFETLLLIAPDVKVDTGLGPKVARPFNAALLEVAERKVELRLHRDDRTGELTAQLDEGVDAAARVVLHVRGNNEAEAVRTEARAPGPVRAPLEPWLGVEAWAVAEDAGGGALFVAGSPDRPRRFPPSARAPAHAGALDLRGDDGDWMAEPARSRTRWPLWVGGAAVIIGGGVAAAFALRAPEPLALPSAVHTGRLP